MSPLVGVFIVSLIASFFFTKYEEKPRATNSLFGVFKPMSITSDSNRPRDEEVYRNNIFDSFQENMDGRLENGLKDISDLDVCIFMVVTQNQKFCMEQNGESLNRLAMLMMHCEIKPEESQLQKCTPEMTFSECASKMDAKDRMTFETLKKRARTVCHEVNQQLFIHNGKRRVQALHETEQLHAAFFTTFKENQKLLQNTTSRSFARLQIQHRRFFKNMSIVWEDFTKKQSSFTETVKMHTALMVEQEKIAVALEEDINVLTEGFLQHIESIKNNFSALSRNIFQRHSNIMHNLDLIGESTDKILAQLGRIQEFDQNLGLNEALGWIEEIAQSWSSQNNPHALVLFSLLLLLTVYFKMATSTRRAVLLLMAAWSVVTWSYILPFVLLGFISGGQWSRMMNSLRQWFEKNWSKEMVESASDTDSSLSTNSAEHRKSTTSLSEESSEVEARNIQFPPCAKKCGLRTLNGTPCRRRVIGNSSPSRCYMHKE